jgi:pimeloyl-ACP methyl ester carboxylesterase
MNARSDWSIDGSDGHPIIGNTDLPAGEARGVVLVAHGFKGYKDYGMFPRVAATLADAGFVSHRFNFSHSGMTDALDAFERPDLFERDTWNRQVFDLWQVAAAVARGALCGAGLPLVFLGHSRGGATCLLAAGRHAGEPGLPAPAGIAVASAPSALDVLTPPQRRELLERGFLVSPSSRTGQALRIGREFLTEQMRDPLHHDLLRLAGRITCPVLIVHGSRDPTVPVAAARRLAGAIPGAELRIVEGADHVFDTPNPLPPREPSSPQLQELLDALLRFAAACCASTATARGGSG